MKTERTTFFETKTLLWFVLLATGTILVLREIHTVQLEDEVSSLRRQLQEAKIAQTDFTSTQTQESNDSDRVLRSSPKRSPPQPPFPLSQLDAKRHSNAPSQRQDDSTSTTSAGSGAGLVYKVQKRTFSDSHRLAFFAGVEGTGHHFWTAVFEDPEVESAVTADPNEFGPTGVLWQLAKKGPELCNKACDGGKSRPPDISHSPYELKKSITSLTDTAGNSKSLFLRHV
jgi:hypothetical protein